MSQTSIEWCDATWNPVRGCTRVSPGCKNCYAEAYAARDLPGMRSPTTGKSFAVWTRGTARTAAGAVVRVRQEPRWTGAVELIPSKLDEPLRWRKPRRVFVNSMSDLFHESLSDGDIDRVFAVMALAPQHTFQILSKRPERMRVYVAGLNAMRLWRVFTQEHVGPTVSTHDDIERWCKDVGIPRRERQRRLAAITNAGGFHGPGLPLPNVWLGVSVEDQATADERIPLLLQTPAAKRFVSYEPGLAGIDFQRWLSIRRSTGLTEWVKDGNRNALDWIIVGGESGPGARPFDLAWARSTIAQCKAAGVACFYKQGGASNRCPHDSKGGHFECFPPDLRVREFPA